MAAPGDLVIVTWLDAVNEAGWHSPEDSEDGHPYAIVHTIGKVYKEDDQMLTLCTSWGHQIDSDVGGLWRIPHAWIKNIEDVVAE